MNKSSTYIIAILLLSRIGYGQQPKDLAFNVSTTFLSSPFRIVLKWKNIAPTSYTGVYRKSANDADWNAALIYLNPGDTTFVDNNAVEGEGYEYRLITGASPVKYAYLYVGKKLDAVHYRGKIILVVDNTYISELKGEISRLINDLIGDGWQVMRHDIARSSSVTTVKSIIINDYNADTVNVKSLFILGHIAVPYSGEINPDGHSEHTGAWPADGYYADMKGEYTDVSINNVSASRAENRNKPGDGKFDQIRFSKAVILQCGRVDLYNMPAFSANDALLMKRYLNKDHAYRIKKLNPKRQALIDDNFGYFNGESFATSGWRNFYALVGSDSTIAGDYFTEMKKQSYIWSYGCGPGSYTSCSGVGNTSNFATDSLKSIFTMSFGSYYGDWDNQNNFLRAPLASKGWTLTNCWSGRPHWVFEHFGLGYPIGFSAKVTQTNSYTYDQASYGQWVHVALMGDPSLRMHIVSPADSLKISMINNGSCAQLKWKASKDSVLGYYIYRADSLSGAFSLLTKDYVSATSFYRPLSTNWK